MIAAPGHSVHFWRQFIMAGSVKRSYNWLRGNQRKEYMRKTLESLLIFVLLSFPAAAQTTASCREDVRHLKLPEHAFIDDVLGLAQPPLVFLFSQDGVDVYSATDFKAMQLFQSSGKLLANAFTVILVYQDEQVRQKKIDSLRKENPYYHLEDLKFATWRFELTPVWDDNALKRRWLVAGMAYFKPVSCEPMESRMPASSEGYLEATINGKNRITGRMPPIEIPVSQRHPAAPNSVLARTLEIMRQQLQSFGLPN
jgi:hypothetical protein